MNVKKVWLEIEDEHGDRYMVPASVKDVRSLSAERVQSSGVQVEEGEIPRLGSEEAMKSP